MEECWEWCGEGDDECEREDVEVLGTDVEDILHHRRVELLEVVKDDEKSGRGVI